MPIFSGSMEDFAQKLYGKAAKARTHGKKPSPNFGCVGNCVGKKRKWMNSNALSFLDWSRLLCEVRHEKIEGGYPFSKFEIVAKRVKKQIRLWERERKRERWQELHFPSSFRLSLFSLPVEVVSSQTHRFSFFRTKFRPLQEVFLFRWWVSSFEEGSVLGFVVFYWWFWEKW